MPYAGDLTPAEAFQMLADSAEAVLVDVRTAAEWAYVGTPDLTPVGKKTLFLEWVSFPDGLVNGDFVAQLTRAGVPVSAPVVFLCRSGVRSVAAANAASAAGYERCYNVLEGFEGPPDAAGHRNSVGGWRVAGLPWVQK